MIGRNQLQKSSFSKWNRSVFVAATAALAISTLAVLPNANAETPAARPFITSIDTMKESKDLVSMSDADVRQSVSQLAAMNTKYITVDNNMEYAAYARQWVQAIRASGKSVWFRVHPDRWEGDHNTPADMTPDQYLASARQWILNNPDFFKSGDILDINPEAENSPYWKATYGPNWSWQNAPNQATDAFNQFQVDLKMTADNALGQLGISGVDTGVRSTTDWFAYHPEALYPSTVAYLGHITIDGYPDADTTDPQQAASIWVNNLTQMYNIRKTPILIGEMGYSNNINVDDTTQQRVIAAEMQAIGQLSFVEGINYWVGMGSSGTPSLTQVFVGTHGAWRWRPAAHTLADFFMSKNSTTGTTTTRPTSTTTTTQKPTASTSSTTAAPKPPSSGFSSGFETIGLQALRNTVDKSGYPAGGMGNVSGICCNLNGPESALRSERQHSGASALMYSGKDTSNTMSYAYMKLFDLSSKQLVVGPNSTLSYWVYPQGNDTAFKDLNGNSRCVAIDLIFTDGTNTRDSGLRDSSGAPLHPKNQCNSLVLNQWNHVTANLGTRATGKTIKSVDFGYDQPANTGAFRGYLDDLSIN